MLARRSDINPEDGAVLWRGTLSKFDEGIVQQRNLEVTPRGLLLLRCTDGHLDVRWRVAPEEARHGLSMHHTELLLQSAVGTDSAVPRPVVEGAAEYRFLLILLLP